MGNSKIDKELFLSYTHNDEWANLFEKLLRATKEPGEPSVYGKTTPEYDILQEKRLPKYIKKKREREEKMKSR
jgi:hypothetical protein